MRQLRILWVLSLPMFGQTAVDLRTQSKNVDFSAAPSTKPIQTGSSIPATCAVGQMFFLTSAPAGSNVYGCESTNIWTLEGGGGSGGATAAYQLTDGLCLRTSTTVVTCSFPTSGTNFGSGNSSVELSASWTVTISATSGLTTFYQYWNPASPGAISIDTTASSFAGITCNSGCVLANPNSSGYPIDVKPVSRLTAGVTANQWDAFTSCLPANTQGCIDDRAVLSTSVVAAGANLASTVGSHGIKTITLDSTSALAWTGSVDFSSASVTRPAQSGATNPSTCATGKDMFINTSSTPQLELCTSANTWTAVGGGGGGGGGGSSTAKVPIWEGSFFQTTISGGGASNSSVWQIGGAGGGPFCSNTGGGNPPEICQLGLTNSTGQNISYLFIWDTNITAIDLHFVFGASSSSGGNFRFLASLGCQTLGTTFNAGTWTYGAVSTGGTLAATGPNNTVAVAFTGIAIPTCAAGSLVSLNLTRDQTVSGNDADDARLYGGSIIATRTLP